MNRENYIIVSVSFPKGSVNLARLVNQKITEGYEPKGGIVVYEHKLFGSTMLQAMKLKERT